MIGKIFLVHKALEEAENSVFQEETVISQAKCFQWNNYADIKRFISWQVASSSNLIFNQSINLICKQFYILDQLYHCRDFLYGPEHKTSGCYSLEAGHVRRREGEGRKRAILANNGRYILFTAHQNMASNVKQIQEQFLLAARRRIASQIIRNRLYAGGLIMPDFIQLVLWGAFLNLKKYNVSSNHHALLILVRSSMLETHLDDKLLQDKEIPKWKRYPKTRQIYQEGTKTSASSEKTTSEEKVKLCRCKKHVDFPNRNGIRRQDMAMWL
ncbi:hypothetical protein TNCV_2044021 [Trichonephila clavipes]|nr:hypothetical protein TNCV_2044021 [Trichonephila clavipes]